MPACARCSRSSRSRSSSPVATPTCRTLADDGDVGDLRRHLGPVDVVRFAVGVPPRRTHARAGPGSPRRRTDPGRRPRGCRPGERRRPLTAPATARRDRLQALQTTPQDPIDQIALAWRRGADPFASTHGLVVWQRSDGPEWRALYAFTDRPRTGVLGISMEPGDLTGDGIVDLLTNEHTGGSGACGRWRVVASNPGWQSRSSAGTPATPTSRSRPASFGSARPSTSRAIRTAARAPSGSRRCAGTAREWVETGSETQPVG